MDTALLVGELVLATGLLVGLCRALNFCLPLAGLGVLSSDAGYVLPLAAIWLYVTSLTYFAQHEVAGEPALPVERRRLTIGTLGVCLSAMSLVGLHWILPAPHNAFVEILKTKT